jgi:hypothetical protein
VREREREREREVSGDHVVHGSSTGEVHLWNPGHGKVTSTTIPELSLRPSSAGSRLESTQCHYGIECVCAGHETIDCSHEGEGDHYVSQHGSH